MALPTPQTVALIGLSITGGTLLWKTFQLTAKLEREDLLLAHRIDLLESTTNGVRERMEHINTRLSSERREQAQVLEALESYLQKNTSYERRNFSNRE